MLLQVNRLQDTSRIRTVLSKTEGTDHQDEGVQNFGCCGCPFPHSFPQSDLVLKDDLSSQVESSVGPDEALWTLLDEMDDAPKGGGGLVRGFWQEAMVLCSRLQLAAPTGRSPFAALPFPFLQ